MECRLSITRRPPFRCVRVRDKLWIKLAGGPIIATTRVRRVRFIHPVTPDVLRTLRNKFERHIRAGRRFYAERRLAKYATVITVGPISVVRPFRVAKRDRRAWIVLRKAPQPDSPPR